MISLALATYNESETIEECIASCRGLVEEIVVVDGYSTDDTAEKARKLGANVILAENVAMFHINKQKAIDACRGEWILQLDADERVTAQLADEIRKVTGMPEKTLEAYEKALPEHKLFERQQDIVQKSWRDAKGPYNAFFIPRLNFFLGGYLRHGGVYPDGVIRLIRKGKAFLPCKDVHELMTVTGRTGWLGEALIHRDSPTFARYLQRNSRYIDHLASDMKRDKVPVSTVALIDYMFVKPTNWFFMTLIRHKGILDGWRGVVFSFFSALRFARAYYRFSKESLSTLK